MGRLVVSGSSLNGSSVGILGGASSSFGGANRSSISSRFFAGGIGASSVFAGRRIEAGCCRGGLGSSKMSAGTRSGSRVGGDGRLSLGGVNGVDSRPGNSGGRSSKGETPGSSAGVVDGVESNGGNVVFGAAAGVFSSGSGKGSRNPRRRQLLSHRTSVRHRLVGRPSPPCRRIVTKSCPGRHTGRVRGADSVITVLPALR